MTNLKETETKAKKIPLWQLEMMISRKNKRLLDLSGQGMSTNHSIWNKQTQIRNTYRRVLLRKLKQWVESKIEGSSPSYNDYLEYAKHKVLLETEITESCVPKSVLREKIESLLADGKTNFTHYQKLRIRGELLEDEA